jgi:hypothetical protein
MGTKTLDRKPCKACGSENSARTMTGASHDRSIRLHVVECLDCGAQGQPRKTPGEAFVAWDQAN